jgi:hypothetical protein
MYLKANPNREHYNMHLRIFRNTVERADVWGGGALPTCSAKPQRGVRYTILHLVTVSNGTLFIQNIRSLKIIKIQFKINIRKRQCVSATKTNRLILFRGKIAVYCENHTEHTNKLCGTKCRISKC